MKTRKLLKGTAFLTSKIAKVKLSLVMLSWLLIVASCKKNEVQVEETKQSLSSIEGKLKAAGFDLSQKVTKYKEGYIVEGDILITEKQLDDMLNMTVKKGALSRNGISSNMPSNGNISHYRTNDLIFLGGGDRDVKIYLNPEVSHLATALAEAVSRFNFLDLRLTFTVTTTIGNANIVISGDGSLAYYMVSGFPSNGNPYHEIIVNTSRYSSSSSWPDVASTLAHEIGHAIGFRHSDYMNRSYSCSGAPYNEGDAGVGNVYIPGTTIGPAYESWMLSCVPNYDRPFTSDDIVAIKELYGRNVYIKEIKTLNYSNSYSTYSSDYEDESYECKLEFYYDALCVFPYTTSNNFTLRIGNYTSGSSIESNYVLSNGITEIDLGTQITHRLTDYGTLIWDNSSGIYLLPSQLYKRVVF